MGVRDSSERTALMLASENGHLSTVEVGSFAHALDTILLSYLFFFVPLRIMGKFCLCFFGYGPKLILYRNSSPREQSLMLEVPTTQQH